MKKRIIYIVYFIALFATIVAKISYAADTNVITSENYLIENKTIYAVPTSNEFNLPEFLGNVTSSESFGVYDTDNNLLIYDEHVGTGYKLKLANTDYNIVVLGDVTGDGLIEIGDISRLYNHYRGTKKFSGVDLLAGKLTGNDNVAIGDVSKLYNFFRGTKAFSYYTSEYPDGVAYEADKIVDNVEALKTTDASVDQIIQTKGYYSLNDGGGAKYIIEAKNGQRADNALYIKLNNGKIAKLLRANKTINIKQLGAKGDGTTADQDYFSKAINSGADTIYIPEGTYELGNTKVYFKKFIRLIGEDQTKVILKNGTIRTPYGVAAENITFDSGMTQEIAYMGVDPDPSGTIMVNVVPEGETNVIFKNCTFQNGTVASYASTDDKTKIIKNNIVDHCTFKNLGRLAIYHNLTMGKGVYTNNTFTNIGGDDLDEGEISAIFLGDITNNTRYEVNEIIIKDNTFTNLITKDDFEENVHAVNANFIAIRGYNATIDHNTFTNLQGYGKDREGIYTKIQNLTVTNNTLTDAGMGEGYICAKPHFGVDNFNISGNTLIGKAGSGIINYGTGIISNNTIKIEQVREAIRSDFNTVASVGDIPVTISGNTIECGTSNDLDLNGNIVENYGADAKLIGVANELVPVIIDNNIFKPTTDFPAYNSIMNVAGDVTINNNKFYYAERSGDATISVGNTSKYYDSMLNINVSFEGNYFETGDIKTCVRTGIRHSSSSTSNRTYTYKNNTIKHFGDKELFTLINQSTSSNNDTIVISGNKANITKSKLSFQTETKYYDLDDPNFVKVIHNFKG